MKNTYDNELHTKQLSFNFCSVENKKSNASIIDLNSVRQNKNASQKAVSKGVAISALLKEAQSLTW